MSSRPRVVVVVDSGLGSQDDQATVLSGVERHYIEVLASCHFTFERYNIVEIWPPTDALLFPSCACNVSFEVFHLS